MIHKMYTMFDTKAGVFSKPFFSISDGVAKRAIFEAAQEGRADFARYPHDFMCYRIGEFDDNEADVRTHAPAGLGLVAQIQQEYRAAVDNSTQDMPDAAPQRDDPPVQQEPASGDSAKHV